MWYIALSKKGNKIGYLVEPSLEDSLTSLSTWKSNLKVDEEYLGPIELSDKYTRAQWNIEVDAVLTAVGFYEFPSAMEHKHFARNLTNFEEHKFGEEVLDLAEQVACDHSIFIKQTERLIASKVGSKCVVASIRDSDLSSKSKELTSEDRCAAYAIAEKIVPLIPKSSRCNYPENDIRAALEFAYGMLLVDSLK